MNLVLIALAAYGCTHLVKILFHRRRLHIWIKMAVAMGSAMGFAAWIYQDRPRDLVLYGIAGLGLAEGFNTIVRCCRQYGDHALLENAGYRRRR